MKTITRKLSTIGAALAICAAMTFTAVPKARAAVYICSFVGCLGDYCYYTCTLLYPDN